MFKPSTPIIYHAFDAFQHYISGNKSFDEWKEVISTLWVTLHTEHKPDDTDYILTECILRMFFRGAIEIERKKCEWKDAEITVKFEDKEYKTSLPVYDFGIFKNSPISDHFWRAMVYNKLEEECTKIYDKLMPSPYEYC